MENIKNLDKLKKELSKNKDTQMINELIAYGMNVFNQEEIKFIRWFHKPNIYLSGETPIDLCKSLEGIKKVKICLNRIEFGNFA